MPTNDFLPIATAGGANVQDQADYAANANRTAFWPNGGIPDANEHGKMFRQLSTMVAVLATAMAAVTGQDMLDDGDVAGKALILGGLLRPLSIVNINASGNYVPTDANVKYALALYVGGGGGGSGAGTAIPASSGLDGADTVVAGVHAKGGSGSIVSAAGPNGGSGGTGGAGAATLRFPGQSGTDGIGSTLGYAGLASAIPVAGPGTIFGGGTRNSNAPANTGAGGCGGLVSATANAVSGGSGGAGEVVALLIVNPVGPIAVVIGAGGAAGPAGAAGAPGFIGGSGRVVIFEF